MTTVPHAIHRIERGPRAHQPARKPDLDIRCFAAFLVVSGILCLNVFSIIAAFGLIRMKVWARNLVAISGILGLAFVFILLAGNSNPHGAASLVLMLASFIQVAWIAYRWDRFR